MRRPKQFFRQREYWQASGMQFPDMASDTAIVKVKCLEEDFVEEVFLEKDYQELQSPTATKSSGGSRLNKEFNIFVSCESEAARNLTLTMLQHLPAFNRYIRQESLEETVRFLENKPEIYYHDNLAYHVMENARLRNEFMFTVGALTSDEIAELGQSTAKNRAQYAHRLKSEGKILVLNFRANNAIRPSNLT